MRHKSYSWPWQHAYAGHSSHNKYESRWHSHRGSNFGVRRPLRHLSHRLDLDDSQVRRMASVLNQLKTEREQASIDEKRSIAAIADLLSDGTPTLDECRETLSGRIATAKNLNEETAKAIVAISDLLDDDQRMEFTNLLLTGGFTL
jgi:hypothetical protein